jgi:hypothetical protein
LRPADRNLYYQIDNTKSEQEITVTVPSGIDDAASYIIFSNNSSLGGVSLLSPAGFLSALYPQDKRNINGGETVIYRVNPRDNNDFQLSPGNQKPENIRYRPGFVYSFDFDGAALTLTDARPLHRIGEPSWSLAIPEAAGPLLLVPPPSAASAAADIAADSPGLFVPAREGFFRYTFDSAGQAEKKPVPGEGFDLKALARSADGAFLLAGYYDDERTGAYSPVVKAQRGDAAAFLAPSLLHDRRSAYFLGLAEKKPAPEQNAGEGGPPVWLALGAADSGINPPEAYKAYLRAFTLNAGAFTPLWELGPAEFDAALAAQSGAVQDTGRPGCGALKAAVYDPGADRWLLTGSIIQQDRLGNPLTGSYVAVVTGAGEIADIDFSFPGMSINKILREPGGQDRPGGQDGPGPAAFYLAGEEQKNGQTGAVLVKYDPRGRELWRFTGHPAHSFYLDAALDKENAQIVLAGTLDARDQAGTGGRPFIEGVDPETGTLLWREDLSALGEAALVTGIVKAPDYGFVLALSGFSGGYYTSPYIAVRVNARGRLVNRLTR